MLTRRRRVEKLYFLEVHLVLQLAQHGVVNQVLIAQRGDLAAFAFQHAEAHLPHLLLAPEQFLDGGTVFGGQDQRGLFFVFLLQTASQVIADADLVGDLRQRAEGGLDAAGAGQPHLLVVGDVVGDASPADDGGQRGPLDQHGHQDDEGHDEDEQAAVGEGRAAQRGRRDGQRRRERDGAAESRPRGDETHPPGHPAGALRLAAVQDAKRHGGQFAPEDSGHDHDAGDGERDECGVAQSAVDIRDAVHRVGDLDADEYPQRAVDQERRHVPEGVRLQPGTGADHHGSGVGEDEGRREDGNHTAAVDHFGQQERRKRGQQAQRPLLLGRVDPFAQQGHRQADQQARGDPAEVGGDEPADQIGAADLGPADGDVDGDGIEHQRRAVVDEALGAQHRHLAARQPLRQAGHGGRVGGGEHGAQDRRRVRLHAQRPCRPRHRHRGGDHQGDAEEDDDAQVRPDLTETRVQALPVQDCRQEQQQHDLAVDVDMAELGDQAQQPAEHDEQQWGPDPVTPADDGSDDDGGYERDDEDEAEHQANPAGPTASARPGVSPPRGLDSSQMSLPQQAEG